MHIPFILIDNTGKPAEDPQNITVRISKDGGTFVPVECTIHCPGLGCYMAHLSESQLSSQENTLIHISADDCQPTLFEYIPDDNADLIAKAVWNANNRTLTSLSTGSQPASIFTTAKPKTPFKKSSTASGVTAVQIIGGK